MDANIAHTHFTRIKYGFNPRARDGREYCKLHFGVPLLSFNPRARDGREDPAGTLFNPTAVSIHAPVMDAKSFNQDIKVKRIVSIHAPVMDAKATDS